MKMIGVQLMLAAFQKLSISIRTTALAPNFANSQIKESGTFPLQS